MRCNHERRPVESEIEESITFGDVKAHIGAPLPHKDYIRLLKSVKIQAIKHNTLCMLVTGPYNAWMTYLRFEDWDMVVGDLSMSAPEAARLLLYSSAIKIHCNCPSWIFHGYEYIATQLDAAIVPEERFPHKTNPNLLNFGCKHIRKMIPTISFHLGDIAGEIKKQRNNLSV